MLSRTLGRLAVPAYSLLRFFFGALFWFHGAQKIFGAFGGRQAGSSLMIAAGVIELAAGAAIALGFFTQLFALVATLEMGVAYFRVHAPRGPWPIENGGEAALLFLFGFLYIMTRGSGRFSIDALRGGRL